MIEDSAFFSIFRWKSSSFLYFNYQHRIQWLSGNSCIPY